MAETNDERLENEIDPEVLEARQMFLNWLQQGPEPEELSPFFFIGESWIRFSMPDKPVEFITIRIEDLLPPTFRGEQIPDALWGVSVPVRFSGAISVFIGEEEVDVLVQHEGYVSLRDALSGHIRVSLDFLRLNRQHPFWVALKEALFEELALQGPSLFPEDQPE
jgi:hypothetical protein